MNQVSFIYEGITADNKQNNLTISLAQLRGAWVNLAALALFTAPQILIIF